MPDTKVCRELLCKHGDPKILREVRVNERTRRAEMVFVAGCEECGIDFHFEPTLSENGTVLTVRLVPGIGGECVPVE